MKIKMLASAAMLACLSGVAQAEISYNYVQATYQMETDNDIFQWELKGSYQVNDQLYVTMDDQNIRSTVAGNRSAGVGAFMEMDNGMHLYGQFSLGDYTVDMYPIIEGGVRFEASDEFELRGLVRMESEMPIGGGDTGENIFGGEAVYHATDLVSFTGGMEIYNELDVTVMRFGARVNFD